MRQLTILALLFCLSLQTSIFQTALSSYSSYTLWKERFGISYSTITEDAYRFAVWLSNSHAIAHHNKHSGATYKMGENQFTAMTSDEFAHYVGQIKIDNRKTQGVSVEVGEETKTMGADIDWTTRGAVNPVKYEGQCACSYAYSAAAAIEGQYFLKKGSLINVSWQQFIDCTVTYGNHGCNGGYMTYCFDYARNLGVVND
jgi:cathepsin L